MTPQVFGICPILHVLCWIRSLCLWTWPCVLGCGRRSSFGIVLSARTGDQWTPTQRLLLQSGPADKTFLRALHVTNSDGVVNLSTLLHGHYGSRNSLRTTSMSWSMPMPCTLIIARDFDTNWSVLVLSQRAEGGRSQLLEQMWLDWFAVWRWITLGIDNSNTCAVYASATINVKVQQQLQGGPGDKRQRHGYPTCVLLLARFSNEECSSHRDRSQHQLRLGRGRVRFSYVSGPHC